MVMMCLQDSHIEHCFCCPMYIQECFLKVRNTNVYLQPLPSTHAVY